jgi:hypothetical protein
VAEEHLLLQIKRAAHHFIEPAETPESTLEWLALMQHYGAPTRLLDFTWSPYVACYFALEKQFDQGGSNRTEPAALWAIQSKWLVTQGIKTIQGSIGGYEAICDYQLLDPPYSVEHFDVVLVNHAIPLVLPVEPAKMNERLLVQQGLFLCPGNVELSFAENLQAYAEQTPDLKPYVIKLLLSPGIRYEALFELHAMNINRASLFKGLDGFAQSLGHKLEVGHGKDKLERAMKALA